VVFLAVLTAALIFQYFDFLRPGKSLYLAYFYDPSPKLCWYPWLVESSRQIHNGHFPLWCGLEGAGMPLLANTGSAPLHPFNLLFEIFPHVRLLDYALLFRLFLLGIFTYWFAIELRLSPLAAACSALCICFSGYISRNVNYILLNNDVWLPAALLTAERMVKDRVRLSHFLLFSLIAALELIGGSPQSAAYLFALIFVYVWIRGRNPGKEIPALALAICLGGFLVSAQTISFLEYFGFAWTAHGPNIHAADRPATRQLFSLFFPWIFGNAHADPQMRVTSGYLGLVPMFLALATATRMRRLPPSALFFWIVLLVFAGIIFYLPPFSGLNYLPALNRVRNARSAYFGLSFAVAMLAGFGLDSLIKDRLSLRQCASAAFLASLLAALAMALALLFPVNASLGIAHSSWLMPALLLVAAAVVCLAGSRFSQRKAAAVVVAALLLVNLLYLAPGLKPFADIQPEIWRPKNPAPPPIIEPIMADKSKARFLGVNNVFPNNMNILFGINDLRAFEALRPKSYVAALAEIEGFGMTQAIERYVKDGWDFQIRGQNIAHPLLDRLGVKYLLADREISDPTWQLISRTRDTFLYQNREAWPRAWVVNRDGAYDFDCGRITEYTPDRVTVRLHGQGHADLVLSDQYAPGWRAFSSGRELRIIQEQGLFRKVAVSKDDQAVRFIYRPSGFEIGLFMTIASLLSLLALVAILAAAKHRRPRPTG